MAFNTSLLSGITVLFLLHTQYAMAAPQGESIPLPLPLEAEGFEHIKFSNIKANQFIFEKQMIRIDVDESSSFLMLPFDEIKTINSVRFKWQSHGKLFVKNAQHEQQRDGDDAVFKLGLLLRSSDTMLNLIVPSWLKQVADGLRFPSEKIIDLVADSKHAVGEKWKSPYNDSVTMISIRSFPIETGWQQAVHQFKSPVEVVAIWLMADGDNTHSSFSTQVKDIELW